MDKQVEQLKLHIAEPVEVRRDWMVKHESRVVSAADIEEIEDTAGALGAAVEALDSLKFKIEVYNRLEDLRQRYYASEAVRLTDEMLAWQRRMTYMKLTGQGIFQCSPEPQSGILTRWFRGYIHRK